MHRFGLVTQGWGGLEEEGASEESLLHFGSGTDCLRQCLLERRGDAGVSAYLGAELGANQASYSTSTVSQYLPLFRKRSAARSQGRGAGWSCRLGLLWGLFMSSPLCPGLESIEMF